MIKDSHTVRTPAVNDYVVCCEERSDPGPFPNACIANLYTDIVL